MTQNKEWMAEGNMWLYPNRIKGGFKREEDEFILEVARRKSADMPPATVQLIFKKGNFKTFVDYLSGKLRRYERKEGEIEPTRVVIGPNRRVNNLHHVMTTWKPDEIYWED